MSPRLKKYQNFITRPILISHLFVLISDPGPNKFSSYSFSFWSVTFLQLWIANFGSFFKLPGFDTSCKKVQMKRHRWLQGLFIYAC